MHDGHSDIEWLHRTKHIFWLIVLQRLLIHHDHHDAPQRSRLSTAKELAKDY
jgi:hypothetical protein